jgi:hypothetical protein
LEGQHDTGDLLAAHLFAAPVLADFPVLAEDAMQVAETKTDATVFELRQAGRQLVGQKPASPGLEVDGFEVFARETTRFRDALGSCYS